MHGKIMMYMDATGRGTVMNLSKAFFDFNRQNWHDKKSMPSQGTFVEFHADGKRITSIKPSKYQEFKEGDFITEQDFKKCINKLVYFETKTKASDGRKRYKGKVISCDDGIIHIYIKEESAEFDINVSDVAKARIEYEF